MRCYMNATYEYSTNIYLLFLHFRAKQDLATLKRECMRTGGGSPPADLPKESDQVLTMLGTDLHDAGNLFDNDAMPAMCKFLL